MIASFAAVPARFAYDRKTRLVVEGDMGGTVMVFLLSFSASGFVPTFERFRNLTCDYPTISGISTCGLPDMFASIFLGHTFVGLENQGSFLCISNSFILAVWRTPRK